MVTETTAMVPQKPPASILTPQQQKNRRARNIAIGLMVGVLVLLVYALTIAKLGGHVGDRVL